MTDAINRYLNTHRPVLGRGNAEEFALSDLIDDGSSTDYEKPRYFDFKTPLEKRLELTSLLICSEPLVRQRPRSTVANIRIWEVPFTAIVTRVSTRNTTIARPVWKRAIPTLPSRRATGRDPKLENRAAAYKAPALRTYALLADDGSVVGPPGVTKRLWEMNDVVDMLEAWGNIN